MNSEKDFCEFYEKNFADNLRLLRNERKISAREMSISLGQNVNYVNLIENGKRLPSMQGFFSICRCLKITPEDFFSAEKSEFFPDEDDSVNFSELAENLTERQKSAVANLIQAFRK
jgi:transcriptional regulator with XRE-family HTH domain